MYHKKAVKLYNRGRVLQQQGRLAAAEQIYRKALNYQPNFVEACNNLGNVQVDLGRLNKAVNAYKRALNLKPGHPMLLNNLGNALQLQEKNEEAVTRLNEALTINPEYADAHNNLGNALFCLNELNQAESSYRRAIEIEPMHKSAYCGLGHVLSGIGEIDKAVASYRKAIEIDPTNTEAYRSLSKNKKFSDHDSDVGNMETLYSDSNFSARKKMNLAFGLGKAYEDLKAYENSFNIILEANRLKRTTFDYSVSEAEVSFNNIKEVFSQDFFTKNKNGGHPDERPIFILGMPRSGTSLTEQILASHPQVFGAGELNSISKLANKQSPGKHLKNYPESIVDLEPKDFLTVGNKYVENIHKLSPASRYIIDKMPHNFQYIGFIKAILPNAKIIHCTRNPMDNCLSIFKNYFATGHPYAYNLVELGQYYNLYLDLMHHWETVLPGSIYISTYESMVSNQDQETRKLLKHCDLSWDNNCLNFHQTQRKVNTASNAQVRQPIYKDSVKLADRYGDKLKPLEDAIYGK
ncbi:MAG: tetratricopeptide repeat protein [Aestuariibacter sp.]|nr:tetratricopeptide repeat protein [Aestuariibacter sp.]